MSRKQRRSRGRNHDLANERPTRRSARLKQKTSDDVEGEKKTKSQRNVRTCPVFTCSRRNCVELDKNCEFSITDENSNEDNTDSDRTFVKTLTFSSSDSTAGNLSVKRSKVLGNFINDDRAVLGKEKLLDEQGSQKGPPSGKILKSLPARTYNLRSRSRQVVEIGSETSNTNEEKVVSTKKARRRNRTKAEAQKAKMEEKKNENHMQFNSLDTLKLRTLNQFAKPSSLSLDAVIPVKQVKKLKEKKAGTLARKRELRDMLEQQDEGYEDDAFDGTPFRHRKPFLKFKLSPVILDSSIQSVSITTDTEFTTPSIRTPMNRLRPVGPLSSGTSESDIMTPGLLNSVNRNDIDRYVNQLRRRKVRLGSRKIKSQTPVSKENFRIIQSKAFDFDTNSSAQKCTTTESENCDDENYEDYYWSDIE